MYGKKIIIPDFACKSGEFDNISFYYKDKNDLFNILNGISKGDLDLRVNQEFLEHYYSNKILEKLKKDLKL